MNKKAEPHKRSLVTGDQNGIRVVSLCHFVSEEFDHNSVTLIALYYGKIFLGLRTLKGATSSPG